MNREVHVRFCERLRDEIALGLLDPWAGCTQTPFSTNFCYYVDAYGLYLFATPLDANKSNHISFDNVLWLLIPKQVC